MTPQEIVHELDKHIVGQDAAKRAVAIALRNRWRRQQVAEPLRHEITPKNILMIGPDRRRQDRDRAPAGAARRCAVHQGRGDQVHRSRLRRPRRRHHHSRPGRDRRSSRRASRRRARCGTRRRRRGRRARARRPAAAGARLRFAHRARATPTTATRQKFRKKLREGELDDQRNRNRGGRAAAAHGNLRAARHGGTDLADPVHVPEPGRRPRKAAQDEDHARR